jgi:hypothetical protein
MLGTPKVAGVVGLQVIGLGGRMKLCRMSNQGGGEVRSCSTAVRAVLHCFQQVRCQCAALCCTIPVSGIYCHAGEPSTSLVWVRRGANTQASTLAACPRTSGALLLGSSRGVPRPPSARALSRSVRSRRSNQATLACYRVQSRAFWLVQRLAARYSSATASMQHLAAICHWRRIS